MIDGVVDAEVAVVNSVELLHFDGLVLGVVLFEVERKLLLDLLGVDGGRNLRLALVEHRQHGVVDIVVEQHNALLGRADEVGNKRVGIEYLPVEEDTLCGGGVFVIQAFENLPDLFVSILLVCCHTPFLYRQCADVPEDRGD